METPLWATVYSGIIIQCKELNFAASFADACYLEISLQATLASSRFRHVKSNVKFRFLWSRKRKSLQIEP